MPGNLKSGTLPRAGGDPGESSRSNSDPYLSLRSLTDYSGLSVRKLRSLLTDVRRPLPHYRIGGKILVRRSEFDVWIEAYARQGSVDVDKIVSDVLAGLL